MRIVFPCKNYHLKNYFAHPRFNTDTGLFYLAGPILGGGGWQSEAADYLAAKTTGAVIACPARFPSSASSEVQGEEHGFEHQLDWESPFMAAAATEGCLVFWLPKESATTPRNDGNPYAMMTRDEIGKWRQRLSAGTHLNVVIGIEDGFPGKREIEFLIRKDIGSGFLVYHSLYDALDGAIAKAPWCRKLGA